MFWYIHGSRTLLISTVGLGNYMQAFFLMQVPETRDLGEAVGFGAAVLFAAIFGKTCFIL